MVLAFQTRPLFSGRETERMIRRLQQDPLAAAIQERHIKELEYLATHDTLTGLPNRKRLDSRLNQAIVQANREKEPFVVMLLDLDRLGEINDTLGHEVGDAVLREVADRLRGTLCESCFISHPGGGEFVILLPSAGARQAMAAVRKVQKAFEKPVEIDEVKIDLGISIGVVAFPDHGTDTSLLMRRADVAMRQAKQRKRHGGTSSVWRRWFAGSIPSRDCCPRSSSSPWQSRLA